ATRYLHSFPTRRSSDLDRVDAYGRYIGLVYGGGLCFNAAMVEQGLADVYLYEDGRYHDPAMRLKEYYSYRQPCGDSIETTGRARSEEHTSELQSRENLV